MAITTNTSGVLKLLKVIHANVSGTLKELKVIHANVSGTLKQIHSSAPFKILTGTLTNSGGGTSVTNTSLTNVAIPQSCTAKFKVHIDAIGSGSDGKARKVSITGSDTKDVDLRTENNNINQYIANTDWYGEIQLSAGTYSFGFAFFNVSVSGKGTSSAKVTYSTSTITYEISFS